MACLLILSGPMVNPLTHLQIIQANSGSNTNGCQVSYNRIVSALLFILFLPREVLHYDGKVRFLGRETCGVWKGY